MTESWVGFMPRRSISVIHACRSRCGCAHFPSWARSSAPSMTYFTPDSLIRDLYARAPPFSIDVWRQRPPLELLIDTIECSVTGRS